MICGRPINQSINHPTSPPQPHRTAARPPPPRHGGPHHQQQHQQQERPPALAAARVRDRDHRPPAPRPPPPPHPNFPAHVGADGPVPALRDGAAAGGALGVALRAGHNARGGEGEMCLCFVLVYVLVGLFFVSSFGPTRSRWIGARRIPHPPHLSFNHTQKTGADHRGRARLPPHLRPLHPHQPHT